MAGHLLFQKESFMKIAVTRRIPEAGVEVLINAYGREHIRLCEEDSAMARDALLDFIAGSDAILSTVTEKLDAEAMDAAGRDLKVIANMAVGYDNISLDAATARGIQVTNTPGVLTEATADLAWTLILGAARRAGEAERCLRAGHWDGWGPLQFLGRSVYGQTLGIFGMGRIGRAVARRARGFDMTILYHDAKFLDEETEQHLAARRVERCPVAKRRYLVHPLPIDTGDTARLHHKRIPANETDGDAGKYIPRPCGKGRRLVRRTP